MVRDVNKKNNCSFTPKQSVFSHLSGWKTPLRFTTGARLWISDVLRVSKTQTVCTLLLLKNNSTQKAKVWARLSGGNARYQTSRCKECLLLRKAENNMRMTHNHRHNQTHRRHSWSYRRTATCFQCNSSELFTKHTGPEKTTPRENICAVSAHWTLWRCDGVWI